MRRAFDIVLMLGLTLLGVDPARALGDEPRGFSGPQLDVRGLNVSCSAAQDDTSKLRAALETGGSAAGTTLLVPSGCKVMVGSPGAGDSVADLASNTKILCEDGTAGFTLARKACSAGSETPGAACTADDQCTGGPCVGSSFAPVEGSTYTVFGAAPGTSNVAIRNCSIWVNGASKNYEHLGGDARSWGFCDGTGGSDVLGQGCVVACNAASGLAHGIACTSDAGCSGGACVEVAGDCRTDGGGCVPIPVSTNWAPSGPGKINPVDFANATGAVVDNVKLFDHRRGDVGIRVGSSGIVRDSFSDSVTTTVPEVNVWFNYPYLASVSIGIIGSGARIEGSRAKGWVAGIQAITGATVVNSSGSGYGGPGLGGWSGNTDLLISGAGVMVDGFRGGGSLYCVMPEFGSGTNFLVQRAFCDGNQGAKFVISGSGNQYMGVRGAWGSKGAVVALGDLRGRCAGGTRSGLMCVAGAGVDATYGCPSSTCSPHADFPAGSATHFVVGGGSLLHSDVANTAYLRAADGKRCTDKGGPCNADGDCANRQCRALRFTEGQFVDVEWFRGASGQTAIDLSGTSVGVNTGTLASNGGPSIHNWLVQPNFVGNTGFDTAVKFPALARLCVGGGNAGASCAADETCTGGGACRGPVENFVAVGNVGAPTNSLVNWDASYGDVSGVKGLLPTDVQGSTLSLTAGEALTRGQTVMLSTAAANTVIRSTTAAHDKTIGVVMADVLSGGVAKVLTNGIGFCIAHASAGVTRGDILKPSTTTAGAVGTGTASDPSIATAVESASANATFRCLVGSVPRTQNNAAIFPKFVDDGSWNTTTAIGACVSAVQLASITHTVTAGRTVRLQATAAFDHTKSGDRLVTLSLKRAGSDCQSGSPTTLWTSDHTLASQADVVVPASFYECVNGDGSGGCVQAGSRTYRLCACSGTGPDLRAKNAHLSLTEY